MKKISKRISKRDHVNYLDSWSCELFISLPITRKNTTNKRSYLIVDC